MMSNTKTSCSCTTCIFDNQNIGLPSNRSVRGCDLDFGCSDRKLFKSNIEPTYNNGYTILNKDVYNSKYSKDFSEIQCKNSHSCSSNQYVSNDPRLISVVHSGQVQTLDRPPLNGHIQQKDISLNTELDYYGKNYTTYADVNGGYVTYYISKAIADPFCSPNYENPSRMYGTLYKDPMGAIKPQYDRVPIKCNDRFDSKTNYYKTGLSFLEDSQEHREDMMARQTRKPNETRWDTRWENL